ncbi:Pectate lyase [Phytophthora nicotianae]|uniref:Pectate lyase n=1 Tax=Phytophthora nicotianae TaxID=4792 RepID=A0A0W8D2G0_PHYNI|nr:Pectate lyase [Phytophthora nicotianae]
MDHEASHEHKNRDMMLDEDLDALTTSLQNERKWRNVQVVLPESFELVARVLTHQAQLIQKLEHRIEEMDRARSIESSSDHAVALEERICSDVRRRIVKLRKEIEQNVEQQCSQIQDKLEQLAHSTKRQLKDQELHFKSAYALNGDKLVQLRQEIIQQVEDLELKLMKSETSREAAVPVIKEVTVATPEMHEKDVNAIRGDMARVSLNIKEAEARIDYQCAALRQELMMAIGKMPCKSEITKLLSRKMDAMDAWKQLAEKADSARVEEVACSLMDSIQRYQESTMGDVDRLKQLNDSKADALELVQIKHNMVRPVEFTQTLFVLNVVLCRVHTARVKRAATEVNEKMTVADVKELLDSQSTMNGVQEAIKQVENAAVGGFATKDQCENINHQIQAIIRQLRSEIYQARYAAFFTNYSPAIQVLVNGEPAVLMRSSNDKKVATCSASCEVQRLHHSAGNVAGLSVEVFLALPARALVAISYDIDEKAQGFLNLRKL